MKNLLHFSHQHLPKIDRNDELLPVSPQSCASKELQTASPYPLNSQEPPNAKKSEPDRKNYLSYEDESLVAKNVATACTPWPKTSPPSNPKRSIPPLEKDNS